METESPKRDLIEKFTVVTGVEESRARFYLESAAWKIEIALANFYEEPNGEDNNPEVETMDEVPVTAPPARPLFGRININESDSDEEGGQEFYVGGSETSGQQVVGPRRNKKHNIVDDLFKAAKEHGAETMEEATGPKPRTTVFRGMGHRLGDTEGPSSVIGGAAAAGHHDAPTQHTVVLRLWQNGFCVDDGPLRGYKKQENQDFLGAIQRGEVPHELVRLAKGREVNVNMEDHRSQDYQPPKTKCVNAFTGQGYMLGSPAPNITQTTTTTTHTAPAAPAAAPPSLQIDTAQPVTSLQIRLADGTRLVSKFNHSHCVGDIRRFISASRPEYANMNFILQTTFPNRELSDDSQSLEDASLLNAVIIQRPK